MKKNRLRLSKTQRENEELFLSSLCAIFDCALQSTKMDVPPKSTSHTQGAPLLDNSESTLILSQESNLSQSSVSSQEIYAPPPQKKKKNGSRKKIEYHLSRGQ